MKIAVIIKEVPDTEARILLKDGRPDLSGINMVVNPYDEYAVEEALRQAEQAPGSTVTAICAGTEASRKNITSVLALGVDDAVLINDPALPLGDPRQAALALAAVLRELKPDLILAGKQGVDYDLGYTAIAVAEFLGIPHVGIVTKLDCADGKFRAESDGDDGKLITQGPLPAVFTAEKALNEPRYASLKGIMAAKKKPVVVKSLADLGLDAAALGGAQSAVEFIAFDFPAQKQAGRMIAGETVQEQVAALVSALRNEAKVV